MKCLMLVMALIGLVSCSSTSHKREVIVPEGEPEWIYAPANGCKANELCASGNGETQKDADISAKKNLSAIFETKINSKYIFSQNSFSDREINEMQEEVKGNIVETVSGVLKGSEILERFKKDKEHYSLAAIDKEKSQKLFTQEIQKLDSELIHFYSFKSRVYIKKLNVIWNKREILNEKLLIVATKGINSPVSFTEINNLKFKAKGPNRIYVRAASEVPSVVKKKIENVLTDVGYKITKADKAVYKISLDYKDKEEYINVRGFQKYTYSLSIEAKDSEGKIVGTHSVLETSTGRTKKDAFLKVRGKIINDFQTNIDKLNLK